MDARLLQYYNEELRYLREAGAEFSATFPKIAARLGIESLEVTDPYVERLLEGCAFLAARIQLKLDAEFPRFSTRLLELVYPNFLAPMPAMLVAQVTPHPDPGLMSAPVLPRQTALYAPPTPISETRCEFRTAEALQLTPLTTVAADYVLNLGELGLSRMVFAARPRSAVRVRLRLPEGLRAADLQVDRLRFHVGGQLDVAIKLYELLLAANVGVLVSAPGRGPDTARVLLPPEQLSAVGYEDDEAMLPVTHRGMSGLRLLQEYFVFPERFRFVDLAGLRAALAGITGNEIELHFLFSRQGVGLDGLVEPEHFALHCVPAVNLFQKRLDRLAVSEGAHEFHVVPNRAAPLDFEVFDILTLAGTDTGGAQRRFLPLFAPDHSASAYESAYFTLWREPRLPSEKMRRDGPRSGYVGSEVFVSLVDPQEAPWPAQITQLSVTARCTNRDLPLFIPAGSLSSGFTLDTGMVIDRVQVVAGPSRPHTALRQGGVGWRLINLLSLNYLSLLDTEPGSAVGILRDLLSRLPLNAEVSNQRQIESLQAVQTRPVVRRHWGAGPIAFCRGIEVTLTVDEVGHEGGSVVAFGAALHAWLARHVSLNSFVETVLVSLTRGEIMRYRMRPGLRPVL